MPLTSSAGGWLGIRVRYELTETMDPSPTGRIRAGTGGGTTVRTHEIRVEEVFPDGPARAGGVAPGDRILRIDGMDAGRAFEEGILAGVRPGQVIRFGIERGGRVLEARIVAASRPASSAPPTRMALAQVRSDSIVSLMQIRMDSARASAARALVSLGASPERPPERQTWVVTRPGFHVDSVRASGSPAGTSSAQTLRALVSGGAAGPGGPILVYATGQRSVLGAEVTPLNTGLAGYFGVDAGLLVTQVVEGGPGARGGLTPGDVIVRVGTRSVSTIEEFRAAAEAGFRAPPLVLGVVREGRRLELNVPR
jgi:S1-C subfamily serine protease